MAKESDKGHDAELQQHLKEVQTASKRWRDAVRHGQDARQLEGILAHLQKKYGIAEQGPAEAMED